MKVLITGASGYIGKSLIEGLSQYHDVTAVTRKDFDLLDQTSVNFHFSHNLYDVVLHCAVKGGSRLKQDDWQILDDNLRMYYNLFNNRSSYKKLIHFGSGAELYAENTPYGYSKSVIRKSILQNSNFYNIRIYGVFDENELVTRFIKANVNNYINKKSISIHQNKRMDFFYMKDLVSLIDYYIKKEDLPKEIDCTYEETKTLLDIAHIINQLSDYRVDIAVQQEGFSEYFGKYTALPLPYTGLVEGIKRVYDKIK